MSTVIWLRTASMLLRLFTKDILRACIEKKVRSYVLLSWLQDHSSNFRTMSHIEQPNVSSKNLLASSNSMKDGMAESSGCPHVNEEQ
jgi:hypothetical protein